MNKFKLMQILPSLRSGGVEQGTIDVANYLASLEMKNFICSNGGQMVSYTNKKYVDHYNLPVHSKNFFWMPFIANKLNKICNSKQINILHIRSRAPAWLLPYINKQNIKTVSTFHNAYSDQNIIKTIYNKQLSKVDKIVAISNYVKEEIIKRYKLNAEKITIINRGVDTNFLDGKISDEKNFITFLKNKNIDMNNKIVLFPGRITNWKGQVEFTDVIESFKDEPINFYFIGDDKNKSYLKKLIKAIKHKKIENNCKILGHLTKEELKFMYKCSNLIISAPLKPEGFGRIISEALAMKKIVLAYNFGGVKDQLNQLDKLYKIKPFDKLELKNKIDKILNLDKNYIDNLGNEAREHIIRNFSKKNMLNKYFNFYQEL